jgi:alpha-aminoadipate/glutamate carrier protein LysW
LSLYNGRRGRLRGSPLNPPFTEKNLKEEQLMTANCPECDATLTLADDVVEGEIVMCSDCAAELEVRGVDPIALALAPQVGEDWGE